MSKSPLKDPFIEEKQSSVLDSFNGPEETERGLKRERVVDLSKEEKLKPKKQARTRA